MRYIYILKDVNPATSKRQRSVAVKPKERQVLVTAGGDMGQDMWALNA